VTVPAIGAIGGVLAQSVGGLAGSGEAAGSGTRTASGATGLSLATPAATGVEQTAGVGSLAGVEGASSTAGAAGTGGGSNVGVEGSGGGESGGFGEALTQAISSLQQTQTSAAGAAQALATGTAANPESAVVTVENAQLAMQLASQIRTKAVEAAQQIFQTQM
jgi:flagellar hook-basal body complex protein FliE